MTTLKDVKKMIDLDGGIVWSSNRSDKLGWRFSEPSRKKIKEFKKKSSIDYWSHFLLEAYAGTTCFKLNEGLRAEKWIELNEFCKLYEYHLNESLDKIESNDNQTVWRWSHFSTKGFDYLKNYVGQKIMIPQFLSTSNFKNPSTSNFFEILTCNNSNGKYIAEIVDKKIEGETLFKSKTIFEIHSFDDDTIYMEEVKSDEFSLVLYEEFWKNDIPDSVYFKINP